MEGIKVELKKFRLRVGHAKHVIIRKAHWVFHCGYLGFVSIEAHGTYRYMAGALLVVVIIGASIGEEFE